MGLGCDDICASNNPVVMILFLKFGYKQTEVCVWEEKGDFSHFSSFHLKLKN